MATEINEIVNYPAKFSVKCKTFFMPSEHL